MHLTNPKAIFVWLSIVALALPPDAARGDAFIAVAGCAVLGMMVFFGYALAFSTELARRVYRRIQRAFNAALAAVFAAVFAYAGLRRAGARCRLTPPIRQATGSATTPRDLHDRAAQRPHADALHRLG